MFKAHNPSIEKCFFHLKKKIHNNECSLPVCIFKEYFNCWGTFQLLPFKTAFKPPKKAKAILN